MTINITIVGFGTMGRAIAKALSSGSSIKIFTIDIDKKDTSGIKKSDFIILSVKPQNAKEALEQLRDLGLNKKTILISIMAGYSIKKNKQNSGHKKIIRMMPNLGLSVGEGIAVWKKIGLSRSENKKAKNFIDKITGNFEVKDEDIINKVTAISGSGPAYFFLLAESMERASTKLGLSKKESRILVEKTFLSASLLGKNTEYSTLIKKIASKGGTTKSALKVFKSKNFDEIVLRAIESAYKRAKQLNNAK